MRRINITQSFTNPETQSVDKYLTEIGKIDMITAEDEVMLAQKIRDGDHAALERLTKANLRFVVSIAKQYQNQGMALGDLINQGNLGLIKAAKRFDETRGFKFISYAVFWIRHFVLNGLAEYNHMIHVPDNQLDQLSRVNRLNEELESRLERQPTPAELAELAGIPEDRLNDLRYHTARTESYDAPLSVVADDDHCLLDRLACQEPGVEELMDYENNLNSIHGLLNVLPSRERQVIKMTFGIGREWPMLAADIARELKLSPESIRQIRMNALETLRWRAGQPELYNANLQNL